MSFEDIQKQIQQDIAKRRTDVIEQDDTIAPSSGPYGAVMSKPGTEKIDLDTSLIRFMECESAAPLGKHRYCLVTRGVAAKYPNQFVDSNGDRVSIIPQDLYRILLALVSSAAKQVQNLTQDRDRAAIERDLYKMTIDALKKTGVLE